MIVIIRMDRLNVILFVWKGLDRIGFRRGLVLFDLKFGILIIDSVLVMMKFVIIFC